MEKTLVLIPARYQSTRFPGKPLAKIAGKSMIQRVYENCLDSGFAVWVVTDSDLIQEHVHSFGGLVCRVDDDVPSGSLRIQLAYERYFQSTATTHIINVQGDEPLLQGQEIKKLAEFHRSSPFHVATLVKKRSADSSAYAETEYKDWQNPNIVKAIFNEKNGECHYFSRSPIPYYAKDTTAKIWYQHVGIYSYTLSSLQVVAHGASSFYEEVEKLEQLKVLDESMRIGALMTDLPLIGVDVPADIKKIEGVLGGSI